MTRTKEIGLRGALGGVASAYAAMRLADRLLANGFLYGVSPADPVVIGLASLLLVSVAAAAAYLPARRAASVDPMTSLRHD